MLKSSSLGGAKSTVPRPRKSLEAHSPQTHRRQLPGRQNRKPLRIHQHSLLRCAPVPWQAGVNSNLCLWMDRAPRTREAKGAILAPGPGRPTMKKSTLTDGDRLTDRSASDSRQRL